MTRGNLGVLPRRIKRQSSAPGRSCLVDRAVGACDQGDRQGEAEGPRGLCIHREQELGRLLGRDVGRPRALHDLVDEGRGTPPQLDEVDAIARQAARRGKLGEAAGRQAVLLRQRGCRGGAAMGQQRTFLGGMERPDRMRSQRQALMG
jgi:hypothetical protein